MQQNHGIRAALVKITPECRSVKREGYSPFKTEEGVQLDQDNYALERAWEFVEKAYKQSLEGWRKQGRDPVFNVVLFVERPEE